jgi:hypothetical protein
LPDVPLLLPQPATTAAGTATANRAITLNSLRMVVLSAFAWVGENVVAPVIAVNAG